MDMVALTRHPSFVPAEQNGLVSAGMFIARRIRSGIKARSDRRFLQSMPDRILADIGISRSGIDKIGRRSRRR